MVANRQNVHRYLFLFGLSLAIIGLGVSRFLLSIGGMLLALNWLLEGGLAEKLSVLKRNKPALLLIALFVLHLLWLLNTENWDYAFKDIRIKLPLLLFPVVLGTSKPIAQPTLIRLLWLFTAVVLLGTLLSIGDYFTAHNKNVDNIREIIFFSSPIRFSLLLVIALSFVFYLWQTRRLHGVLFFIIAGWITGFLVFIQSLTGIVVLLAAAVILSFYYGLTHAAKPWKYAWMFLPVLFVISAIAMVIFGYNQYITQKDVADNFPPFEVHSAGGEMYEHHMDNMELENGYYIYRYVAQDELERAWNRNSSFDFNGKDQRNQLLRHTTIRYLSSLGLRKDSIGFSKLTQEDIRRIEQGYTTAVPPKNPLLRRMHGTYFEINAFHNNAAVQGGSLTQRLVFFANGWRVARENWLFGVGTGDVNDELLKQYNTDESQLPDELRRRPHNQYLTFLISFGIIGLLYFLYLNFYSVKKAFQTENWMTMVFTLVATLSFLTEDTLETQIGASFYAILFSLFMTMRIKNLTGGEFCFNELWRNPVNSRAGQ